MSDVNIYNGRNGKSVKFPAILNFNVFLYNYQFKTSLIDGEYYAKWATLNQCTTNVLNEGIHWTRGPDYINPILSLGPSLEQLILSEPLFVKQLRSSIDKECFQSSHLDLKYTESQKTLLGKLLQEFLLSQFKFPFKLVI